jgi:CubicO group peptidase (beta-lactamase class C family)
MNSKTLSATWLIFGLSLLLAAGASANEDWPVARPAEVGLDAAPLEALAGRIASDPAINVHSVLVAKDGKLVFERYFTGRDQDWGTDLGEVVFDSETRHDLRSVSKSVTSALVGIAVGEGRIPGTGADVFELFPEHHDQLAPEKHALELRHILSMTAGLDWFEPPDYTNPGNDEIRLIRSPDPVAFVLGRGLVDPPGSRFAYNGGLPTLLGYLLEKAYGKRGDEVLREKLLEPLGIEAFDFRSNDSGLLAYASGIRLRPRDMARIGQLYLQHGRWNDRQLIPADWVRASLSPQVLDAGWAWGYGYQWWIGRIEADGKTWDLPMAVGNGNQRIILLEPLNLVMVVTAGHYNQVDGVLWGQQMLMQYVLPAAGVESVRWVLAAPESD